METNRIGCELLVIGGSAGSLDVLIQVLPGVSSTLPFAILIVLHRKYSTGSALTDLLAAKSRMPVREVEDKEQIIPGHLYIAPSDYHVLLENKQEFALDFSEKINYSRPSIDVSFESAAYVFRQGVTALLLSGSSADGMEGLRAIRAAGGYAAVQLPSSAQFPFMPQQAIDSVSINRLLDIEEMAEFINNL
jgi:two-component system chemotaxis response regulator CheB